VIEAYTAAMEARNLGALKVIWPGLAGDQEARLRASFQLARSVRLTIDVTGIQVANGAAVVTCRRKDTVVTTEGRTAENERTGVIRLAKADTWTIVAVQ
jgi:hypothetical protein